MTLMYVIYDVRYPFFWLTLYFHKGLNGQCAMHDVTFPGKGHIFNNITIINY